jgi:hypothetical protein
MLTCRWRRHAAAHGEIEQRPDLHEHPVGRAGRWLGERRIPGPDAAHCGDPADDGDRCRQRECSEGSAGEVIYIIAAYMKFDINEVYAIYRMNY